MTIILLIFFYASKVLHLGVESTNITSIGWDNKVLVTPEEIIKHDVIITIGKTVQYALLSSIPVYCYDHYGGPGYLNNENYNVAKYHNFSGRGFARKSSEEIVNEIENNFIDACEYIKSFRFKDDFNLDIVMDNILNRSKFILLDKQCQLDISVPCFYEELIANYYNATINLHNERNSLIEERNNHVKNETYFIKKSKKYKKERNIFLSVTIVFIVYIVALAVS